MKEICELTFFKTGSVLLYLSQLSWKKKLSFSFTSHKFNVSVVLFIHCIMLKTIVCEWNSISINPQVLTVIFILDCWGSIPQCQK